MKIERVAHPTFGHRLNVLLKEWSAPWLAGHYACRPDVDGMRRVAALDHATTARPHVVAVLSRENERLSNPQGARLCAELLERDALVVMCGQQPGLFGGSLLSFEKAAGAIVLARRLRSELSRPVVPIYWNQSEDHDLEEVNRLEMSRPEGVVRLRAPIEDLGRSLDAIVIDDSVVTFARDALVESGLDADPVGGLLPVRGERFSDWTSRILLHVFADDGLLIAEPSWFRGLTTALIRRAIVDAAELHAAFARSTEALQARGIEPQIEARDKSMLFLLDHEGTRRRLLLREGAWEEDKTGARSTEAELLARLETEASAFSTNVQLRAAVQQFLFPVVAQVGGPAEVAYFAQFPELFKTLGLPLPAMIVRPDSTVLGPKEAALREALQLSPEALMKGPSAWPEPAVGGELATLADLLAEQRRGLAGRLRDAAGNDALRRAVDGHEKAVTIADDKLLAAFRRDRERESGVLSNRRARLEQWIFPRGKPQNRVFGILPVLSRAALPAVRRWLSDLDPLDGRHVICTFEEGDR